MDWFEKVHNYSWKHFADQNLGSGMVTSTEGGPASAQRREVERMFSCAKRDVSGVEGIGMPKV